ncbi:MAG TPA: PQQ-binding-like beta-propeller repeat protein [Trebonia sp.]
MRLRRRRLNRLNSPGAPRRPVSSRLALRRLAAHHPALRRLVLAAALLAVLIVPLPVLASDVPQHPPGCQGASCHAQVAAAQLWAVPLAGSGTWTAGTAANGTAASGGGDGGTVPANGQAYAAVGDGLAVIGAGLTLTAYQLDHGKQQWQLPLTAAPGTVIMSVRAWPGVITVGLLAPSGRSRTEVVVDAATGAVVRRYPAAVFGGAVIASAATTVVIGASAVTSYNNATGRVRWRHPASSTQSWEVDGQTQMLYVAEGAGGSLSSAPVTALRVINLATGTEHMLSSPLGSPFSGTLAMAAGGAVLFASDAGVTAYSGSTGGALWTRGGAVPEGTDPEAGLVYLTFAGGTLRGVDPLSGVVQTSVAGSALPGSGDVYVVRGGTALGLDPGANGAAWGYSTTAGRAAWNPVALPWPHFFSDVSGLGGSAEVSGGTVVVTACPHLAASPQICADPELIAFAL